MKAKTFFLSALIMLLPIFTNAQCAMCRAVLESSGDNSRAEGINQGIMYLMVFPYILIAGLGVFLWLYIKNHKKEAAEE